MPSARAQTTPAGTNVANISAATFTRPGATDSVVSNPVVTRVLAVHQLGVTPPGTVLAPAFSLTGTPGDTLYTRITLANLGNGPDSVSMAYAALPPSTLAPANVVFFLDLNANNRFDAGEDNPSFLALASTASTPVDAAIVLPAVGAGVAFVELRATSARDPALAPATDATVVRVTSVVTAAAVHFGPAGNARALPGGDGSVDDETTIVAGPTADTVIFQNDIENAAAGSDSVEVVVIGAAALPLGVIVSCTDTTGTPLPASTSPGAFIVGTLAAGEVRPVRVVVSSPGTPLRVSLGATTALSVVAESSLDTLVTNQTIDRIVMPVLPDPLAMLGLEQTFRQATAAIGDVVTMTVTVVNRTDSIAIDNVRVFESLPPALDFLGGSNVARSGTSLTWNAGTLAPGETRATQVKFAVNSRESKGWARASGSAAGDAQSGDQVSAGPVVAAIRIDNEEWGIEGFILGDVWIDDDGDGDRDEGEPGVANVSLYLESGEHVVTDSLGVFSIPHVFEGYRVVRLDEGSLPGDVVFDEPLGPVEDGEQPVGRRNERLVHLIAPGHVRVAFPLRQLPPPTVEKSERVACEELVTVTPRARMNREMVVPSSYFAFGRATLLAGAEKDLARVANFLADHPAWQLLVEGHTDNVPIKTARYPSNFELSVARAESVRNVLVSLGVPEERILVLGAGDTRPMASNTTVDGRMLNRRVEVSFIPPGHEESSPAQKVAAAVRDVSALPDSARATVTWTLTTSVERPQRGTLRVDAPAWLIGVRQTASMGDSLLVRENGAFLFDMFARGHGIECRLSFTVALADTHRIRDIEATLSLVGDAAPTVAAGYQGGSERDASRVLSPITPPPGAAGAPSATPAPIAQDNTTRSDDDEAPSPPRVVTIRPASSANASGLRDVLTWTEQVVVVPQPVPAPADTARAAPATHDGVVAILEPRDDEVFANRDQVSVRVRHPLGSRAAIVVNGEVIGEDQVGQRTVDVAHEIETTTWYGVRLDAGWNQIAARAVLLQGGEESDSVRVALSSRPAELVALDARHVIPADGKRRVVVRFAVLDVFGLPVMDGWPVTLVEGAEFVSHADARPALREVQATTMEGLATFEIAPRHATGAGRITVEMDGMRASTEVVFVTPDRPLLATGVVDLSAGLYDTGGEGSGQGVENFKNGLDGQAEARLFVQGAAPGGVSVTARVDTRKRYDDPLLKQPDPEKQYPIFGDASSLHYSAPARGGNYLSLDRGQSYLRYGDLRTPIDRGEFLTYQQVVTGLSTALVGGANSVRAFVTETDFVTFTDNIPADGTSGFYYLSRAPIVENSERVVIETRDRFRSEVVLEARVMLRRRDYTVNPYDGSILFMEPVPVTDRELNPNTVAVTYETESDGVDAYLFGVRGDVVEGKRYRAGVTAVANSGDGPGYALYGADGEVGWRGLRIGGEIARSDDDAVGSGDAYKVGASASHGSSKLDMYLRRVDGDFSNPSFRGADREYASVKGGFDGRWAVNPQVAVHADGYAHEFEQTDELKESARATVDYRRRLLEMSAGLRVARHDDPADADDPEARGVLALAGLTVGSRGSFGVSTTLEQNVAGDIVDDYPNRLKTVLAAPLSERFRAIATYEYATASGLPSTHQVTAGVEGTSAHGTQAYTRYALDRAASDARMGAVSGIRQQLRLNETTSATVGVEGFLSMAGRDDDEYVSLTTGLASKRLGKHFVESGYEYRWEDTGHKHLVRLVGAQQLGGGFAWLTKNVLGVGTHELQPGASRDEAQYYATLAGTYRSPHAPVQSLAMVKSYYDRYAPVEPDAIRWRLVASIDVNAFPNPQHEVRFKYAYKHVEDWSDAEALTTDMDLVLGQYVWRFAPGWDLDAWGRVLRLRDGGSEEYGTGIEIGRLVFRSVRVGVGYSLNGFDDPDVTTTDAWSSGFGVRLQVILSDWLLADFEGLEK
ncbi:MAG: OmpA family protein [Candidatus Latescibacteria bacterium]|nr:OmpA family protein [Candidatus Latescibacterota bacterium]